MRAVAIKKGQSREKAAGFQEMGVLRCDGCGEEFVIGHPAAFEDKKISEKQAAWLEKVLAEEVSCRARHPTESNCRTDLPAHHLLEVFRGVIRLLPVGHTRSIRSDFLRT